MPVGLEYFYPHLPPFLLVLFRITGIFFFAPVLGSSTIPFKAKVMFTLMLSFCVYPMLLEPGASAQHMVLPAVQTPISVYLLPVAIAMELMIGFVIGYGASLPMIGLQVAGQVSDQQMGIGFAGLYNPEMDVEMGVVSQFYFLLGIVLFLIVGGHRALLATVVGSFGHVPLGGFEMRFDILEMMVGLLTAAFELALRVCAPLLCLIFLETLAMGFLARTVPQLNILSVGFPLRIVAGLLVLISSLAVVFGVWREANYDTIYELMRMFASHGP